LHSLFNKIRDKGKIFLSGNGGAEWVVRKGVGAGGEMTKALYAHMNNKTIKKERHLRDFKTPKIKNMRRHRNK
jgi:hypothetical protein